MTNDTSAESETDSAPTTSVQLVLGWNPPPASSEALRYAAALAVQLNAHLHVVHVADFDDLPIDPDAADWEDQLDQRLADDEATARTVLDTCRTTWTYHAARGRPSEMIAQLADQTDAMMIILGSPRGGMRSYIETLAGQSVAHQLTRGPGRPVLIVPESASGEDTQR